MAKKAQTLKGKISGMTQTYLGSKGARDINARGNKLASHNTNYRNIRAALGLTTG
jgi:hypothetical protein